jgi:transcriptional regulator with XRE-family HTH domain
MYTRITASQLAGRVRSLVGQPNGSELQVVAADLGVAPGDLREIIEFETRYPSLAILAALVTFYGVDASWLLTGAYSPATHRADEELGETPTQRIERHLRQLDDSFGEAGR